MYPNQNCTPCQNNDCPEVVVPTPPACAKEPCVEITSGECVRYTGPNVTCLNITTGMTLNQVVAQIAAKLCACCPDTPVPTCTVPTNLTTTSN